MAGISFSGLASGIDGDAIIKALVDARRLADAPTRSRLQDNQLENTALNEFNTKLLTLSDSLKDLRTLAGGALSKTAQVSNGDALGVSAGSNATASTTTINILQLAKSGSISFNDAITDASAPLSASLSTPGTFDVTVGAGDKAQTISVPVDDTTSLNSLVTKLNDAGSGKIRAFTVNVGSESAPQYKLVVSSVKTGVEAGSLSVQVSGELAAAGLFQSSTVQDAQDAKLSIDGIGIVTRASNQISDLLPGLTLDLKQDNTGPVTVSVGSDTNKTAQKLQGVVEAFNAILGYSSSNSKIERVDDSKGVSNTFGTLARTNVDEQVVNSLRTALAQAKGVGSDGKTRIFADLGIKTERDGTLSFDQDKFSQAVSSDPSAVQSIMQAFADNVGSTNGVIDQYTRYQGTIDSALKANDEETKRMNEKLNRNEEFLAKMEQDLKLTFSRLESTISGLNSQASALTSLITSGLGSKR